jgi:hypothetical protein
VGLRRRPEDRRGHPHRATSRRIGRKRFAGIWEEAPSGSASATVIEIDVDLIASDGASSISRKLKDFDAVMGGAVIRF